MKWSANLLLHREQPKPKIAQKPSNSEVLGKIKNHQAILFLYHLMVVYLAADLGFEPRQTESESAVLPLHKSAIRIT